MPIFNIKDDNELIEIDKKYFKLEKDIQSLTEQNLKTVFNLEFVSTEFSVGKFRIDTLGYDKSNNSFVIIEYKRDRNFSVIDQGYSYLSLLLNNKAEFILEYNEKNNDSIKKNDVDWSQSKIIFVSQEYTTYQKTAVNFKDIPIELWEIKRYDNKTVSYTRLSNTDATESIKSVSKRDKRIESVSDEIKVCSEEDHLKEASDEIRELYDLLKTKILSTGDIQLKATKKYIAFQSNRNVVDIVIQKRVIKLWINLKKGTLDDPKELMRDVSNIGHWGNGEYEASITFDTDIDYLLSLIRQSYIKNSN